MMMNNHKALAPPLAALPSAGRREGERSEADRSSADGKAGPDFNTEPRPNPEVVAKAKRRSFTGDYKRRILAAADRAKESGDVGAVRQVCWRFASGSLDGHPINRRLRLRRPSGYRLRIFTIASAGP